VRTQFDLSDLSWKLAGFMPYGWHCANYPAIVPTPKIGVAGIEVEAIPARVPGSVQGALREAGVIPDWNEGLNSRQSEWVESRHWVYETFLPDDWLAKGRSFRLVCLGLDYAGWVVLNGRVIGEFRGSLVPHMFDFTGLLAPSSNRLQIAFDCPPRWLGQLGYTSRMKEWKPRFNYGWDWTCRLVQIGIWDDIRLEVTDGPVLEDVRCFTGYDMQSRLGSVTVFAATSADAAGTVRLTLKRGDLVVARNEVPLADARGGYVWKGLPVEPWYPNGHGEHPVYTLVVELVGSDGSVLDAETRHVGFKHVEWRRCEGAPEHADPWICVVNGVPVFLQGVNWSPIRPNFADLAETDYRTRLEHYRDMGCTIIRVWGGGFLEKPWFHDMCDEMGLMVWGEFPLSSSGLDNWPPEDEQSIASLAEIAESYIRRRQHHVSLLLWCGGNELYGGLDGGKVGSEVPVTTAHPLIRRLAEVVKQFDPTRRFLPASPSGPISLMRDEDIGKGLHWDMHGPWKPEGRLSGSWTELWAKHDAYIHSEIGSPGASSVEIIRRYRGDLPDFPASWESALWRRTSWWIEWDACVDELGREPADLEEYVAWSQARQREALTIAARSCKARFPRCGGFIVWHGHDSFPCTANNALLDFHGDPKPAAYGLAEVFHARPEELR